MNQSFYINAEIAFVAVSALCFYFCYTHKLKRVVSTDRKIYIGELAESSKRFDFMPIMLLLPKDDLGCRLLGVLLFAILLFPTTLLMFLLYVCSTIPQIGLVNGLVAFAYLFFLACISRYFLDLHLNRTIVICLVVNLLLVAELFVNPAAWFPTIIMLPLFWLAHRMFQLAWSFYSLPQSCKRSFIPLSNWLEQSRFICCPVPIFVETDSKYSNHYFMAIITQWLQQSLLFFVQILRLFLPHFGGSPDRFISVGAFHLTREARKEIGRKFHEDAKIEDIQRATVYLRHFGDDLPLSKANLDNQESLEEHIVRALLSGGTRVVALGKPGEDLPPLGAERFYVNDEDWQNVISKWLKESFSVVMIAALSEATSWEIAEIFRTDVSHKLLILFPFTHTADIAKDEAESLETVICNRLRSHGATEVDLSLLEKGESLVAMTFDETNQPILITAQKRDSRSLQEAIKLHISRLKRYVEVVDMNVSSEQIDAGEQPRFVTTKFFQGAFSIDVPVQWKYVGEEFDFPKCHSKFTIAAQTMNQKPLDVCIWTHATKCGTEFLPDAPAEWILQNTPACKSENQLEFLYSSEEKYGSYKWYCATYMWMEADETITKRESWAHLGDPAHMIVFTGLVREEDRSLMRAFASSLKPLKPLSQMRLSE